MVTSGLYYLWNRVYYKMGKLRVRNSRQAEGNTVDLCTKKGLQVVEKCIFFQRAITFYIAKIQCHFIYQRIWNELNNLSI